MNVTSLGEVPDGVEPPTLISRTSNSLELGWKKPLVSSGNITSYILRQISTESDVNDNENIIYFGLMTTYKVLNLKPLKNYTFVLEVCNSIGCTRSSFVSFMTTDIAPISVTAPVIFNITDRTASIRFSKPSNDQILTAHLIGYIIYLIPNNSEIVQTTQINVSTCAECGINIKNLDNLIPGTDYGVLLSACTNGGCTNSTLVKFRTFDALPEVNDVTIRVANKTSTQIELAWNKPKFPNGELTGYALYKNDEEIYNGLQRNFTVIGLSPNTKYKFFLKVIAIEFK